MNSARPGVDRRPIVLLVDPLAAARFTLWRLLGPRFGVLEAASARKAREWLSVRADIDALVVYRELPDGDSEELLRALGSARMRAITTDREDDMREVVATLAHWFFVPHARLANGHRLEVDYVAS
jgi:hypothetical protein